MTQLLQSIENFPEAVEYCKNTMPDYAKTIDQKRSYIQGIVECLHSFTDGEYDTDKIMIELGI